MKVHFEELTPAQRAGGIEVVTRELSGHLAALGLEVSRSSESGARGVPDCVHVHGIWSPQLARRFTAWCKQGVPCVVTPHGMLEPWAIAHKRVKKWVAWHVYQKRLLNQASLLHGTSEREVGQFRTLGLKPPVALVPWGVATMLPRGPARCRGERTALFVGRIYPVKGLPMLVEAWGRVRPPGWKLRIVGPDEAGHQAEVEAVVRKIGLGPVIELAGELTGSAKDAAYVNADLFILPSYTENFGMAVAEAMAHSLPVLTTTGTPWSLLPERGCGWWVAPTVGEIATALATATALDDETLRAMGARGREWVARDFSWRHAAEQLKATYQWVRGGGPKPDCVQLL